MKVIIAHQTGRKIRHQNLIQLDREADASTIRLVILLCW